MKYRFTWWTLTISGRSESIEVLNAETGAVLVTPKPCRISRAGST